MPENRSRVTPCIGCGTAVPYKTNSRVCCRPCALERKRQRSRLIAERKRREAGVAPVKGASYACSACGNGFIRSVVRQHRCAACQARHITESTRASSKARGLDSERTRRYNAWERKRRANDPAWRVSAHMRVLMHRSLRSRKEGRSWREFVGYTLAELMHHLERQFQPGMCWENHGEWHIDHIVPRAEFQYTSPSEEAFQRCWALPNLRPIWAKDNVRKNATRTHLL